MANRHLQQVMRRIRKLAGAHQGGETSDGPLLERFVAQGDETAFADLLERHGPLVLGVCRRVLHDVHLAEDAFQATFLVLARKAGTLRKRDRIGTWLYSVARRVAGKARARVDQRQEQEKEIPNMGNFLSGESAVPALQLTTPDSTTDADWRELRPLLDEAVDGLPAKYREPFLLCCLEGKSKAEAARQLGYPEGTVSSRLARAREQLRDRLSRRGLALSTGTLTTLVAQNATAAAVPASLFGSTVKAATLFALGKAAAAGISTHIVTLAEGALQAMFITKLKIAAVLLLTVAFASGTTGVVLHQALAGKPGAGPATAQIADPAKPPAKEADPAKPAPKEADPDKPKAENPKAAEPAKEDRPHFRGTITEVSPNKKGIGGIVRVDMEKGGMVPVHCTDKTKKIEKMVGKEKKPAKFEELKKGCKVQVVFNGTWMDSDPSQVNAIEILILEEAPKEADPDKPKAEKPKADDPAHVYTKDELDKLYEKASWVIVIKSVERMPNPTTVDIYIYGFTFTKVLKGEKVPKRFGLTEYPSKKIFKVPQLPAYDKPLILFVDVNEKGDPQSILGAILWSAEKEEELTKK